MTDPALPDGNPFVLPGGENDRPLQPHIHPEDRDLVLDVGGLGPQFSLLTEPLPTFVAVTGPSGR